VTALPQLLVSTVLLGGIYALIAVGLTLIFGIMRVVNFAHGEFLMLGMYLAFWSFTLWGLDPYFLLVVAVPLFFVAPGQINAQVPFGVTGTSATVQVTNPAGQSEIRTISIAPQSSVAIDCECVSRVPLCFCSTTTKVSLLEAGSAIAETETTRRAATVTRRMAMAEFGRAQMYQLARAKAHVFSRGPGRGPLQANLAETG